MMTLFPPTTSIVQTEAIEPCTGKTYRNLIETRHRAGLPYVLAALRLQGEASLNMNHSPLDGNQVRQRLWKESTHEATDSQVLQVAYFILPPESRNFQLLTVAPELDPNIRHFFDCYIAATDPQCTPETQFQLGLCYALGTGVPQSWPQAIKLYKEAANRGYVVAMNHYAWCCRHGYGTDPDLLQAMDYYARAAKLDNLQAQHEWAVILLEQSNDPNDHSLAFQALLKSAQGEYVPSQILVGRCYAKGVGIERNLKQALIWFVKAANYGDANAQNVAGACFFEGRGISKPDYPNAIKYFNMAAAQGHPLAHFNLYKCYRDGFIKDADQDSAILFLKTAVDLGCASAQYEMAQINEMISETDAKVQFNLYLSSALQGYTPSFLEVAKCFLHGKGTEIDVLTAITYFSKAQKAGVKIPSETLEMLFKNFSAHGSEENSIALNSLPIEYLEMLSDLNFVNAQNMLGVYYASGHNTQQNWPKAIQQFQVAAANKSHQAHYNLAECYFYGNGVPKDIANAAAHYTLSTVHGNTRAPFMLRQCQRLLFSK